MAKAVWRVDGEVSEREELLDGRSQVVLEGDTEGLVVTLTLVWLIGREGEVPLTEGFLTLVDPDGGEVNASLEAGGVSQSAETGAASVRATFVVDAVDGALAVPGDRAGCELEIGAESWSGELRLGGLG